MFSRVSSLVAVVVLIAFSLGAFVPASAAVVKFAFTAQQGFSENNANAPTGSYYEQAIGLSNVSGILTYDTNNLAPSGSGSDVQPYTGRIDILINEFSTANPDAPIDLSSVVNSLPGAGGDQFAGNADTIRNSPVGFYDTVSFQFFDATGSAFSSTALPTDFELGDFSSAWLFLSTRYFDGADQVTSFVNFSLTSLTNISDPAPIPIPGAVVFLLTGLLGVSAAKRRQLRA
ncbi:MAG: hypothetical protein AAGC95_01060 [Pseudomonadota bacterium]